MRLICILAVCFIAVGMSSGVDEAEDNEFDAPIAVDKTNAHDASRETLDFPRATGGAPRGTQLPVAGAPVQPQLSIQSRLLARDWTVEVAAVLLLVAYIVQYVRGRRANEAIARQVFDALRPTLNANFAAVGPTTPGDPRAAGDIDKLSDTTYQLWSSGRRDCVGLLVELTLLPRQDIATTLAAVHAPAAAASLGLAVARSDRLAVEIALPDADASPASAGAPFFLAAAASTSEMRTLIPTCGDLPRFPAAATMVGSAVGLQHLPEVVAEHRDIVAAAIGAATPLGALLARPPTGACDAKFVSLHATTQAGTDTTASIALRNASHRVLRLIIALPAEGDAGVAAAPWVTAALALADHLSHVRHSPDAAAAIKHAAEWQRAEAEREAAAAAEEKARRDAIEAQRVGRIAMKQKLSREELKAFEAKERKDQMAAAMRRHIKVAR